MNTYQHIPVSSSRNSSEALFYHWKGGHVLILVFFTFFCLLSWHCIIWHLYLFGCLFFELPGLFSGQVQSVDESDASTQATDDERRGVPVLQALGRQCSNSDPVDGDASCQTKVINRTEGTSRLSLRTSLWLLSLTSRSHNHHRHHSQLKKKNKSRQLSKENNDGDNELCPTKC